MSDAHKRTEILVIGAGPGGTATASRLAEAGHDVLLVDRAQFPRDKTCGDGLTPRCVDALAQMGALETVEAAGAERITGARLVGPYGQKARLDFEEFLTDQPPYGLVLPRHTLDDTLRLHAIQSGARYLGNVKVTDFTLDSDHIRAVHGDQDGKRLTIHADWVIVATGANNRLVRQLGVMDRMPTTVRAIRGYYEGVTDAEPVFDFYFERFLMPGYAWVFPVGNETVNAGVGLWPGMWTEFLPPRPPIGGLLDRFIDEQSNGSGATGWQRNGPAKGYPIRTDFPSHRVAGSNWVLVGETTGLVNPATGEGIDLAIESGLMAADMLSGGLRKGKWRGRAYQNRLWFTFAPMMSGTRVLAFVVINPLLMDYVIWQMSQHKYLAKKTMQVAMGFSPPWHTLNPLFLLQLFLPLPTSV